MKKQRNRSLKRQRFFREGQNSQPENEKINNTTNRWETGRNGRTLHKMQV